MRFVFLSVFLAGCTMTRVDVQWPSRCAVECKGNVECLRGCRGVVVTDVQCKPGVEEVKR